MKKTISLFAAVVALSSEASASWYQEYCSNGEGTVKLSTGHNDNIATGTIRDWSGGNLVVQTLDLSDRDTYVMTVTQEKELSKQSGRSCGSGGEGVWSSRTVNYRRVAFKKADGSLFPANTVGVSRDQKSIQADLICEMEMSGMMPCR